MTGHDAVAQAADIVIPMVPDTPQVADVLFGEQRRRGGPVDGQARHRHELDLADRDQDFADQIKALGCDYLDAPVSGGEVGAKAASLTIMVGGSEAAFDRAKPVFETMGKNITLVGGNGAGQTTKVANQIVVALTIEAVAEALVFASKAGADPAKVRQALMGGLATSRILEVHGERMIKRTFAPGFRIELHQKDLNLALEGARRSACRCRTRRPRSSSSTLRGEWRREGRSLGAGQGAGADGGAGGSKKQ